MSKSKNTDFEETKIFWNELFSSKYFEPSVFEFLGAVFPGALSFAE